MLEKKYHPIDTCVGKQLRKRRLSLKMSQEELAKCVDLTFQQIQKYEKGYNRISSSMLFELAKILDVQICYFFMDSDECEAIIERKVDTQMAKAGVKRNRKIDEDEQNELINCYHAIADKQLKEQVLMLVKAFSKL